MNPYLKFKLNKNLDKKTCFDFLNLKYAGIDFGKGIILFHPKLKNIKKIKSAVTKKKEISDYINIFYNLHKDELRKTLGFFKKEWSKVEDKFFQEVDLIFNNLPWPNGKYICYLSIFNCNSRFLADKTFQVFYENKKEVKRIIAHELLHFIFFHYLNKKFKVRMSLEKKWIISEVFNTIVLNQKNFIKIISPTKELGYPEHRKYLKILSKEWIKNKDISTWLNRANKIVP